MPKGTKRDGTPVGGHNKRDRIKYATKLDTDIHKWMKANVEGTCADFINQAIWEKILNAKP